MAIDQSHEQLNRILKGTDGIIDLTQDHQSLIKWSLYGSLLNKLIMDFQAKKFATKQEGADCFYHDEGQKHQEAFFTDVRNLVDTIQNRGNPFLEVSEYLVSLDGKVTDEKHAQVDAIYKKGKEQYDMYVEDVILNRNTPIDAPIKQKSFRVFQVKNNSD